MAAALRSVKALVPRIPATVAARRALAVQPAGRFLWRELTGRGSRAAGYRLRGSGTAVTLRHGTADVDVLHEIHLGGGYEPPPSVAAMLDAMPRPLRILDLGGHVGMFGSWALRRFPGARVVSVEPDPANLELLRSTIAANDAAARWDAVPAFAGTEEGEVPFTVEADGFSHRSWAADGEGGVVVRQLDAFPLLQECDFAKIDIEGAEWPLLRDPRMRETMARAIAIEFHPLPGGDSAEQVVTLLEAAGYSAAVTETFDVPGVGHAWGWREG